ncbi:hypothetical protein Bbelb_349690 [Branchiostoma belcheri]|nr:hypothetical protein Bbelb_349690 [Branchiostoma belcheri]
MADFLLSVLFLNGNVQRPVADLACRRPVADLACRRPVTDVDVACRRPVADLACRRPVADLACRRPVTDVDVACRRPVADLACRRPVADLACRRPVADLACRRPVTDVDVPAPMQNYIRLNAPPPPPPAAAPASSLLLSSTSTSLILRIIILLIFTICLLFTISLRLFIILILLRPQRASRGAITSQYQKERNGKHSHGVARGGRPVKEKSPGRPKMQTPKNDKGEQELSVSTAKLSEVLDTLLDKLDDYPFDEAQGRPDQWNLKCPEFTALLGVDLQSDLLVGATGYGKVTIDINEVGPQTAEQEDIFTAFYRRKVESSADKRSVQVTTGGQLAEQHFHMQGKPLPGTGKTRRCQPQANLLDEKLSGRLLRKLMQMENRETFASMHDIGQRQKRPWVRRNVQAPDPDPSPSDQGH